MQVHLTAEGRRLIKKLFPRHAQTIVGEMGALTAAEQEELARLCRKLGLGVSAGSAAIRATVGGHEFHQATPGAQEVIAGPAALLAALEPGPVAASAGGH